MSKMDRRQFLKQCAAAAAGLAVPDRWVSAAAEPPLKAPPASYGRIATWVRQAVRPLALTSATAITLKVHDDVIPLYGSVIGQAPWPRNPIWYVTDEGYIHSGYVQPVENSPSDEVIADVEPPGFWAQVCVPIAEARRVPNAPTISRKLYYKTVYRVVSATDDEDGHWWYQIQEGFLWSPSLYVPAWSLRRIPQADMTPISPGHPDKWIEINLGEQRLVCFEGDAPVFNTPISSGAYGTPTPRGEYRVLLKRHTSRMTGGEGDGYYDLPGVGFPTYFTGTGVAIHGTYWHNDFVRPHSHGCVNVPTDAAQWVFRWSAPVVPYEEFMRVPSSSDEVTRIVVV